jgi:hypothetical protein
VKLFIFLVFLILLNFEGISQELNLGGYAGVATIGGDNYPGQSFLFAAVAEYRPFESFVSFNVDPGLVLTNEKTIFSAPVYAKLVFGERFRVGASGGGFLRSNSKYGWLIGISLEYAIMDKIFLQLNSHFYKDYWKDISPRGNEFINDDESLWLSLGIKKNILY